METYTFVIDWYMANVDKMFPILFSIFILGVYLGIAQLFEDKSIRTILIVPAVLIFVFMGYAGDAFSKELFTNLSVQMLAALVAVGIVFFAGTLDNWIIPLLGTAAIAILFILISDPSAPQSSFLLTLGTGCIGAYMTALSLRQEWKWSPSGQAEEVWKSLRERRKSHETEKESFGDFFILIRGDDEGEIQQRIDFLKEHDMQILMDKPSERDPETNFFYRIVHTQIQTVVKEQEAVFLNNNEARLRVLGYPDTVKRVFKQMDEVLEIQAPKRIDAPSGLVQLEAKTVTPTQLFSDHLEDRLFELARTWRASGDTQLDYAATALIDWAKENQLIKE